MGILALHGFTGVGDDFTPFAQLYGGTWNTPNLPGHGPHPQLDCSPDANIRFIQSQAAGLHPLPSILLGYSMGARAALLHAYEYPDRWKALILISPNPGIKNEEDRAVRREVDEKLAQRIEQDGAAAFIEFWQNTPMIRSQKKIRPEWRQAMQANRAKHTGKGLATSLREFGQGSCPNLWPELHKLRMPVLLITGEEDLKYSAIAEEMQAVLPNCMWNSVAGSGHAPHLEHPKTCVEAISGFAGP